MASPDVRCTETDLVLLRPLDEMAPAIRVAVTTWLWEHGVASAEVALGWRIERDPAAGSVTWRAEHPDGECVRRWRFAGDGDSESWPAPFPARLRGETAPD